MAYVCLRGIQKLEARRERDGLWEKASDDMDELLLVMTVFSAVGSAMVVYAVVAQLNTIYHYCVYKFSFQSYGSEWAVVTGASGGIGAEFCRLRAARGVKIILLARSVEKM
ncbi:Very-long-chain 3-oxoacyl-CoA reductase [Gracilariopsis chorda]|uniref:Very-long-chain 3-oxoacyl-CoA reductase n=1 Tax=Gracilariopsis chorda TaxID=448386 RepID=A0A2V3IEZ4_9FLOR|nr:Very-long-chain 3-oxoacyl-CoA reductase [Gracilariopsis chorda]|eukprot:PXF40633.1 Very-long-chain 3-oxoacyl-CoA reductase [Gracilariopsis chorda]